MVSVRCPEVFWVDSRSVRLMVVVLCIVQASRKIRQAESRAQAEDTVSLGVETQPVLSTLFGGEGMKRQLSCSLAV